MDFHIIATLVYRIWTVLAGAITLILLPHWLGPALQGYYYTFASLLAVQIFFELGFNQIIVQLVSHECAHLTIHQDGTLSGNGCRLERLASLVQLIMRWYAVAATLFLVVTGGVGLFFFQHKGGMPPQVWRYQWMLLVCTTAGNLFFSPFLAALEGTGQVGQIAKLRFVQSVAGCLLLWMLLYSGAGLWASTATSASGLICTSWWIARYGRSLRQVANLPVSPAYRMRWREDIFPFQWRMALSWVSGYFIFNLFTPLTFSRVGAAEAGRLGLALTMFSAVSTVGMSWVNAKVPLLGMLISRGERKELNARFRGLMLMSCAATTAISMFVILGVKLLMDLGIPLVTRVASMPVLICLAWNTVVNVAVFCMATYMRAHREEPMLPVSIVTAVLTAAAALFGIGGGVFLVMLLSTLVTTAVTLPWTVKLFHVYHARAA